MIAITAVLFLPAGDRFSVNAPIFQRDLRELSARARGDREAVLSRHANAGKNAENPLEDGALRIVVQRGDIGRGGNALPGLPDGRGSGSRSFMYKGRSRSRRRRSREAFTSRASISRSASPRKPACRPRLLSEKKKQRKPNTSSALRISRSPRSLYISVFPPRVIFPAFSAKSPGRRPANTEAE